MSKLIQRRSFLKTSATAALGFAIIPGFARIAPSDRLRIAHIGVNGMGNNHLKWFAAIPEVDIVALCDVDKKHLDATMNTLKGLRSQGKAEGYADFRRVLDRKDIDAITCATPDHWHKDISVAAMNKGKSVYCEKPMVHDITEGPAIVAAQNKNKVVFQVGPADRVSAQAHVENLMTISAECFRPIHRGIRIAENVFSARVACRTQRHADADSDEDLVTLQLEGRRERLFDA